MPILQSFGPTSTPAIGVPEDIEAVAMRALPGAVLPFPLNFSRKENSANTGTRALHAPSNLTRDDEREFDGIDRLRDVDLVAGRQSAYPIFSACVCGQCHRWNPGTMLSLPFSKLFL